MCSLFRAKGFTWIPPVGHILLLVPWFDREFVMTFQGQGSVRGKDDARFQHCFQRRPVRSNIR